MRHAPHNLTPPGPTCPCDHCAYNLMLERLDISFQQASRFSADAAHELKTPLTILQGRIERAITQADGRAIQADLSDMLDEVGRLSAITRKLLLLAQADAGRMALQRTQVDLTELLDALVADAQMLESGHSLRAATRSHMSRMRARRSRSQPSSRRCSTCRTGRRARGSGGPSSSSGTSSRCSPWVLMFVSADWCSVLASPKDFCATLMAASAAWALPPDLCLMSARSASKLRSICDHAS